jgi:hypothetical protein
LWRGEGTWAPVRNRLHFYRARIEEAADALGVAAQ